MSDPQKINRNLRENKMLNASIPRVTLEMAIPTIIAFLINSIYSLADTYFVSELGKSATAAVSVNSALDQIIMMAGSMLAVGANSYVARLLGAREKEKADKVLSTAFFLALGAGTVFMIIGTAFMGPMVDLLGATDTCRQYAIEYATYVLFAAPFMASTFVMNQCLRAEGSAVLSMIGMGFGGILNCFLDPVFIFGWGPIPAMGVAGASIATAISKLVSFIILICPYLTRRSLLHLSWRNIHCSSDILSQIISVGMPSMLRSGLAVVAGILLNNIAGDISDAVLAGIGVSTKIMMFPFSIILGFGSGFQPVAGFNWGARRFDRVRESHRFASWAALLGAGAMALVLGIFAPEVITWFNAEADPEMQRLGALCIRLQCIALPIHAWVAIVNMLCAGLGYAGKAFLLATARQGTCFLPILYPMSLLMGEIGIVSVQAVADVLTLVLAIPILYRVRGQIQDAQTAYEAELARQAR
ncbi:MAG: MATE family efflux transporter [Oscillospiraceae bacterium]|nr:MATE family efflux transporter [Oscillospiraceae bacterium]